MSSELALQYEPPFYGYVFEMKLNCPGRETEHKQVSSHQPCPFTNALTSVKDVTTASRASGDLLYVQDN